LKRTFEGQAALVTGGGSGIGRAVVEALVAAGSKVCVLEHSEDKCRELAELGDRVRAVAGDATAASANEFAVRTALEAFGRLDTLITFVGRFDNYVHATDIPDDRFDAAFAEVYDTNVKSVLHAVRAAAAALRSTRGNIVITCSSSSFFPGRGGSLYVSSKFALRGLVTQLAYEFAPDVRVNGVAPGGTVATDLRGLRSLRQHEERLDSLPGRVEQLKARTPLRVALTPEDHAAAYLYLASRSAPGVTGEIIRSDGGLSVR
jgi:NAD(P)-dependent dehydrogenase (short-subunit alcohol dehydrogenase family)